MKSVISHSEDETVSCAQDLAKTLSPGRCVFLRGDLGAGKTVFARALIRALTQAPELEVPSPTFTLVQTYETDSGPIWHFDLYRIKDPEEIYELGWEEAIHNAITIIEWPERLEHLMPGRYIDIHIENSNDGENARIITIEKTGDPA